MSRRPLTRWGCGFEFRWEHGSLFVVTVVCCQAEVCATRWPFIQRSPKHYGVSDCDRETSTKRRPWSTKGRRNMENERLHVEIINILWIEMWNEVVTASWGTTKHFPQVAGKNYDIDQDIWSLSRNLRLERPKYGSGQLRTLSRRSVKCYQTLQEFIRYLERQQVWAWVGHGQPKIDCFAQWPLVKILLAKT